MNCPKCNYEWVSRKMNPCACPRCKSRLDMPKLNQTKGCETEATNVNSSLTVNLKPKGDNTMNILDMKVHSSNIESRISVLENVTSIENRKKLLNEISAAADSIIELCDKELIDIK